MVGVYCDCHFDERSKKKHFITPIGPHSQLKTPQETVAFLIPINSSLRLLDVLSNYYKWTAACKLLVIEVFCEVELSALCLQSKP